ncbi:DUF2252 domain-containing protein [Nocardia puris]|uniref:DUF2252 domain-containing protein n=1 Tax=Nocardia puris TaxID=208602 RepID=UPI00189480F6|nr:DUF2252 domain-containing protein [Nocardia puris]MBF6214695.1 DUF2252 domain-containing protein [Nocardia puris]MBF6368831.1 DUF2252 domain-containing protein [Nocardia puris]MBF6462411.1 DUF2252 domain-containing protein [Nocardia puris]
MTLAATVEPEELDPPLSPRAGIERPERGARGREARKIVSRSALGDWDPDRRGHDALETILAQNAMRATDLVPIRMARMAASPWTYYRGAAAVMAADLASRPHTGIEVQLCGDAHVLNFGMWASPERNLVFDLRDFDETLPGPFEWDLLRLGASLVVLARENGVSPERADAAVAATSAGYREAMAEYAGTPEIDIWYERVDVQDFLGYFGPRARKMATQQIERKVRKRTSRGAFEKLTEIRDGRRRITQQPPFRIEVGDDHRRLAAAIVHGYAESVPDHIWSLLTRYRVIDVVRQVVGVGSVGMRVLLALLEERRTGDPFFVQVKQAGPSVYENFLAPSRYDNHGSRVAHGQRMLQATTDQFLGWTRVADMDFYVRQFRDMKITADGPMVAPQLEHFARACARVLARAHARSGDASRIADYLGTSPRTDTTLVNFANAYADQTERDHTQLVTAIADGRVDAYESGWA